ncbi:aspartic peptidase domain-containing protein [Corynascus novoguineensis]|uniref:Aspartic peptidase domain-containing protein n=1 Tax=Corynascus novoguineensis TaxID=1126955 RepID=A0AAN7CKH7_9PEZI|nr:aspartic peptidase domain-containing protein [Corynascus novoguineensis]
MAASLFILTLGVGRALGAVCGGNTPTPMALPITDALVDPDIPDSLLRGIPANVGSPPQSIVVLPWPDLNNTYIYDTKGYCDTTIVALERMCRIRRGGYFRDDQSTSFSISSDLVAAGGATQELGNVYGAELGVAKLLSTSVGGTDKFGIDPGNTTTMPIGIPRINWDHGYTIAHALGLGSNSTFLNSLVHARQIPSRVWSIFWGHMWTNSASTNMDGTIVLGGYDREKVIGNNATQRLDYSEETGCWTGMKVTVSDVVLNFRNGRDYSVMPRNRAVECCIVPQRQLVWEGPFDIVDNLIEATGMNRTGTSHGVHWNANVFDASDPNLFDGDATFVLTNGLSIRVPNSQFFAPTVYYNGRGARVVDRDRRELLMSGVDTNPTTLGRYFLTAAYLMVDHDAGTFTMWQANPTTRTNLVPVVSKLDDGTGCDDDEQEGGGDGGGESAGEDLDSPSSSSSVNAGAIAGGVVGGVAAVAAVAALMFFLLRRRKQHSDAAPPLLELDSPQLTHGAGHTGGGTDVGYYYKTQPHHAAVQEAPGPEHLPRELHSVPVGGLGGAAWGSPRDSPATFELDGGEIPGNYAPQGYPQNKLGGYYKPQ